MSTGCMACLAGMCLCCCADGACSLRHPSIAFSIIKLRPSISPLLSTPRCRNKCEPSRPGSPYPLEGDGSHRHFIIVAASACRVYNTPSVTIAPRPYNARPLDPRLGPLISVVLSNCSLSSGTLICQHYFLVFTSPFTKTLSYHLLSLSDVIGVNCIESIPSFLIPSFHPLKRVGPLCSYRSYSSARRCAWSVESSLVVVTKGIVRVVKASQALTCVVPLSKTTRSSNSASD
ncbi:hypothetical protein FA13DRAFT_689026 [Coprinellus micaceus]|uniref:Secreted protein n=1 Tax=Coprinellus micaceus TaxID=71717 RepID=A0A4Y7T689_COPMI|nr:hypothetical protein FA13DRAFT_689026 [Coprinellus micaceus]